MTNGMTRRTAVVLVMLMMIAVPATAAVITQNFMRADVSLSAACFTKTAGSDAAALGSGFISFTENATVDARNGVTLLQETTELTGFKGDRMIYSDAVRFNNLCAHTIQVSLVSQNDPNGDPALEPAAVAGSIWEDLAIKLYVSDVDIATDPGIPTDSNASWELMLTVDNGGAVTQGGSVTIPNSGIRRLAFVVDTQYDSAALIDDVATLRWTAQAIHP
jgi:hypothetical protein